MSFDLVRETTTTTGTGALTLAGAVAQHQTFAAAVSVGQGFRYHIKDANGTAWEVGRGRLTASTTLARDVVEASSNAGALVSLSAGTHEVAIVYTATEAQVVTAQANLLASLTCR
jgi:hypothetical protein